jgi:hypothetical protein
MKLPRNLGLKAYTIIFTIFALGGLSALTSPDGETYIYYNTLLSFHSAAIISYSLAILDAVLGCLAIIPLTLRAFERPQIWARILRILFILRIMTLFLGHSYEWIVIKSALVGTPIIGWLTIGVWGLFIFPSFKEHFIYAFQSKK